MIDYPKTIKEAREYRYAIRTSNPLQCGRKKGYGFSNLYCRRHARIIKAAANA